jgi:hypothetical protein
MFHLALEGRGGVRALQVLATLQRQNRISYVKARWLQWAVIVIKCIRSWNHAAWTTIFLFQQPNGIFVGMTNCDYAQNTGGNWRGQLQICKKKKRGKVH